MKISKTAVLALGWIFLTAGLGLMVVNAAATDQYKDLLLDLNNAVQHFDTVRFINQAQDSKVDLKRVGSTSPSDPLLGITAVNNLIITESWSNENQIWSNVSNSSILWWKWNKITWWGMWRNVILWWGWNTVNAGWRDIILWWSWNEISNTRYWAILWWEWNKIWNTTYSTIIWNKNEVKGNNSIAVWKSNKVNGSNSAVLWVSWVVNGSNSFLWTDKSFTVTNADVFVVNWENGMVIGGNKAHSLTKLTISGSLFIGMQSTNCNADHKWAIKIMDNPRTTGKCFCSCNGSGWNSLNGKGSCIDVCAGTNNNMIPVCGTSTTCPGLDTSYQWSCEVWQLVQWEWAHFIDKNNVLHWQCMTDNGAIRPCQGSVPSWCPSSHETASCWGIPDTCSVWVLVPNENDPDYLSGHVWTDGKYHWLCKNGAEDPKDCTTNEVCDFAHFRVGDPSSGCLPGSTRQNPDTNFNGSSLNLRWTCELDGRPQICRKDAVVQCNWNETVQKLNELQANPYFNDNRCLAWHGEGWVINTGAGTYTWSCRAWSDVKSCTLYLYPKCSTTVGQCEIWSPSSLPWGQWKCTNRTVSITCPSGEETVNTWYNCKSPNWSWIVVYDLTNSQQDWDRVKPTEWDLTRKCYDSRSTHSGEPTGSGQCQFKCNENFYCTDLDYRVSCAQPKCVGGDDLWDINYVERILSKPSIDREDYLDPVYLDEEYKFWTGSSLWNSADEWCYYRCPSANQYKNPTDGKIRCYSTGKVAELTHGNINTGSCAQEAHLWYYREEPWLPTGWIVNWKYVPRYGWIERDEAWSVCRWTCDQWVPNGFDTYLSTTVFIDEDVSGIWDLKNSIEFGGSKDCRRKCGKGEIYTSVNRCHSCPQDKIPDPNKIYEFTSDNGDVRYKQPYSCIEYSCPLNYELDLGSYDNSESVRTYRKCVCNWSKTYCKAEGFRYSPIRVAGNDMLGVFQVKVNLGNRTPSWW